MHVPIMIVDDQPDIRLLLRTIIRRANDGLIVVGEASNGSDAIDRIDDDDPLVVVLDEMMPEMNGLEAAEHMRARRPTQIIILCSAYLDPALERRARAVGVQGCVSKEEVRRLPDLIRQAVGSPPCSADSA